RFSLKIFRYPLDWKVTIQQVVWRDAHCQRGINNCRNIVPNCLLQNGVNIAGVHVTSCTRLYQCIDDRGTLVEEGNVQRSHPAPLFSISTVAQENINDFRIISQHSKPE